LGEEGEDKRGREASKQEGLRRERLGAGKRLGGGWEEAGRG
jgi:hypothetical protein